jgi:hypothetical protein
MSKTFFIKAKIHLLRIESHTCSIFLFYKSIDVSIFWQVEAFFEAAREDVDLQLQLRQEGIIFFLHLLGTVAALTNTQQ